MSNQVPETPATIIEPVRPWGFIDFRELRHYQDLLYFLIWRNIRVAYAQSVGGFGWAVLQPAIQVLVFTVIFGLLIKVDTGDTPYLLFSTVAVVPWSYLSVAMTAASASLVTNANMLGKTYFPRVIYPLNTVLSGLINFIISLILIVVVLAWYRVVPTGSWLLLPLLLLMLVSLPLAIGLWLSSLAIRYRDVQIGMGYFLRALMYTAPILYDSTAIPADIRPWYILNPIVGIIEGFRSCLLGQPIYWDSLLWGIIVIAVLLVSGTVYFHRMERIIVDVI